jgi:predicted nucleotidyltransferase
MKQINEVKRMQFLAGLITESEFNNVKEAIVNTVSDKLSDIFDEKGIMKSEVINSINRGLDIIKKQFPDLKIIDHYVVGAAVTYQYEDESDIDITVVLDPTTPPEKLKEVDKWIEKNLDGTMKYNARPYQFKVNFKGRNKSNAP